MVADLVASNEGRHPTHCVSFCNAGRALVALIDAEGIVDTVAVDAGPPKRAVGGTLGIAFHETLCYVAVQSHPAVIAVFDATWTQIGIIEAQEVRDIHGLAIHDGSLLIVSTATNQIVAIDLHRRTVRPFWSERDALGDTAHLNDVVSDGRRVFVSRFGRRHAGGQRNGDVFDAVTGEVLVANLREPHSVACAEDGTLHVLESATGDLLRCRAGFSPHRLHGVVGYARGLAIGPATLAIGRSGYRLQSRLGIGDGRLTPLAPTEAARDAQGLSGVFFVDRTSGEARFVDTTTLGVEVYAVTAIPPS